MRERWRSERTGKGKSENIKYKSDFFIFRSSINMSKVLNMTCVHVIQHFKGLDTTKQLY